MRRPGYKRIWNAHELRRLDGLSIRALWQRTPVIRFSPPGRSWSLDMSMKSGPSLAERI